MRPSPIQLRFLAFNKVCVEAAESFDESGLASLATGDVAVFDFNGVTFDSRIDVSCRDENKDDPRNFGVRFDLRASNEKGKTCPYSFDVSVIGIFDVNPTVPVAEREQFAAVNGTTLLYGAVREQVAAITARGTHGLLFLPTVNFLDLKKPLSKRQKDHSQPTEMSDIGGVDRQPSQP